MHDILVTTPDYEIHVERPADVNVVHILRLKMSKRSISELRKHNERLYQETISESKGLWAGCPKNKPVIRRLAELLGYVKIAHNPEYDFLIFNKEH